MKSISTSTTILQLLDDEDFLNTWQELQLFLLESKPADVSREHGKAYPVRNVHDIRQLPYEAISDFLTDIQPVLVALHTSVHTIRKVTGSEIKVEDVIHENEFLWTDDGIRNAKLDVSVFN